MKAIATNPQIPWLSLSLLVLLLILAPYAMSLRPYERIYTDGVYHAPHAADALYPQRFALVLLGLCTAVVAFGQFMASIFRIRKDLVGLAPFAATFLACAVVGWRSYPYWVTGVYQVDIGAFPSVDQDPKVLMPMVWIGESWRVPVVLLYFVCYIAIPLLLVLSGIALWRHQFVIGGITAACSSIALLFMFSFSPDYLVWLMD